MLPLRDGIGVMRELARVLAAVHRRGLTHGAIDPEYVWIEGDQVRISGTGLVSNGTARDDLDQLAQLVWLMFTGAPAGMPPGPLSRRRRGVPAELDQLLMSMLAADPADRPARAETILGALDALPGAGPEARRAGRQCRRRPPAAVVARAVGAPGNHDAAAGPLPHPIDRREPGGSDAPRHVASVRAQRAGSPMITPRWQESNSRPASSTRTRTSCRTSSSRAA